MNNKTADDLQKELKFLIHSFNPPIQQAEKAFAIVDTFMNIMVSQQQQIAEKDKKPKDTEKKS